MRNYNYVDVCRTLEILKQDSGLLPKPTESWNTFDPKEGDYAYVCDIESVFMFIDGEWVLQEEEEENLENHREVF